MASRKISWVSSVDQRNAEKIARLEARLSDFYSGNENYYGSIDFTSDNWISPDEIGYQNIVDAVQMANSICEVGCGNANLLRHFPEVQNRYWGCDFSDSLLQKNSDRHPTAKFSRLLVPNELPFTSDTFDLVFSVFVIEHSTNPAKLLSECLRVLRDGGTLIVLCPDFLGRNRMTSQRAGFSFGTTSQKLSRNRFIDAAITLFDNRIRIPLHCMMLRTMVTRKSGFFVNLDPVVFDDPFTPDVDAVYVTSKNEMISYLKKSMTIEPNDSRLLRYEKERGLIFIRGTKLAAG